MLRLSDPNWASYGQYKLNVPLDTLNTTVLITSSITMVMSWVSLKLNDIKKFKLYMGLTLLCSFGFLVIKYIEYSSKFKVVIIHLLIIFMQFIFCFDWFYCLLHVVGGIIVNGYFVCLELKCGVQNLRGLLIE